MRVKQLIEDLTDSLRGNGQSQTEWLFLPCVATTYKVCELKTNELMTCEACGLKRKISKQILAVYGKQILDIQVGCIFFTKIDVCRSMHSWWKHNLRCVTSDASSTWRVIYARYMDSVSNANQE